MSYKEAIEEFNSEDENGKSRLVYAYFGLAIYFAQCLEQTFINMIWLDRVFKKRVKFQNEVNEIIDAVENSRKTMGALIHEVKTEYSLPGNLETDLKKLLDTRNYLAHKFFKEQIQKFETELGQKEMLKYFCDFVDDSKGVDNELNNYYYHYTQKLGLTEERIIELMEELKEEEIERVKTLSSKK
jgi:hypothetical protein